MGSQISSPVSLPPCGDLPAKTESADQQRGTCAKDTGELLKPEPDPNVPLEQTPWDDPAGVLPSDRTIWYEPVLFRAWLGPEPEPLRLSHKNNNTNRVIDTTLNQMRDSDQQLQHAALNAALISI